MPVREAPAVDSPSSFDHPIATRTILISGASGMVGSALVARLTQQGHRILRLVRDASQVADDALLWDPQNGATALGDPGPIDAVVHLAGENVAARRWSTAQKARIRDSRVDGTQLLVEALGKLRHPPSVFVCASAIGVYGDQGDQVVDERSSSGAGFLAAVCREWEEAAAGARSFAHRVVSVRFGVILSRDGGALAKMLTPFKLGLGGAIGSGRQWMSWVALPDVIGAIEHVLEHDEPRGPVNVVAPEPVTNADFTKTLGAVLGRPTVLPMPAFAAKLAFGEMAEEMLLASTRVAPQQLGVSGYEFAHPELEGALRHVLGRSR